MRQGCAGFTLVELIVVIVIMGIIAGIVATFLLRPVQGFDAVKRRAELVDAGESALRRMQRDIRSALPNSIRIREAGTGTVGDVDCPATGSICALELLYAVDGGRYRAEPPGGPATRFQFGVNETDFDVIGTLQNFAQVNPASDWVVVNNQTTTGNQYNAYFGDNRGQLSNVSTTATHINLVGKNFAATLASPRQRFYVVNSPVTFLCNTAMGTLTRYAGYAITANHAAVDTDGELTGAGAGASLASQGVSGCRFAYTPGTNTRSGLVTIALTLRDADTSEQVRLLHQVRVHNMP